jgi:hypothetical protein
MAATTRSAGRDAASGEHRLQLPVKRFVGNDGELGAGIDRGAGQRLDICVGGERYNLELRRARRARLDHIERGVANRTGRAQN